MGREIRRVPPDWQHPTDARGHYKPLFDSTYAEALEDYRRSFTEWNGSPPNPDFYRPAWPEASATAFQVYETVSEGTPVSPVFPTREELVDHLLADGVCMGADGAPMRLTRQVVERFVDAALAPSPEPGNETK